MQKIDLPYMSIRERASGVLMRLASILLAQHMSIGLLNEESGSVGNLMLLKAILLEKNALKR